MIEKINVECSWRNLAIGLYFQPVYIGRGAIIWVYPCPFIAIRIIVRWKKK
jgi:hypothetical protein